MLKLRFLVSLAVAVALAGLAATASASTAAGATARAVTVQVHFKRVAKTSGTPSESPNGRYMYFQSNDHAILLDTRTGKSARLSYPPRCNQPYTNGVGNTNILVVCDATPGRQTAWVQSIATHRLRKLPAVALGPCGSHPRARQSDDPCQAEAVGRAWTVIFGPLVFTGRESYMPMYYFYNLKTGKRMSASDGTDDYPFGAGGRQLQLNSARRLVTKFTVCSPIGNADFSGWVGGSDLAFVQANGGKLYLQRCGSSHKLLLSSSKYADAGNAAGNTVVWAICRRCRLGTGTVHGYDLDKRRFFTVKEPSGVDDPAPTVAGRYLIVVGYKRGLGADYGAVYEARLPSSA